MLRSVRLLDTDYGDAYFDATWETNASSFRIQNINFHADDDDVSPSIYLDLDQSIALAAILSDFIKHKLAVERGINIE